jgi:hypothetical protein
MYQLQKQHTCINYRNNIHVSSFPKFNRHEYYTAVSYIIRLGNVRTFKIIWSSKENMVQFFRYQGQRSKNTYMYQLQKQHTCINYRNNIHVSTTEITYMYQLQKQHTCINYRNNIHVSTKCVEFHYPQTIFIFRYFTVYCVNIHRIYLCFVPFWKFAIFLYLVLSKFNRCI